MLRSVACGVVFGAIALLLAPRLREPPAPPENQLVQLPAEALRAASGGYEAVLADGLWLSAIQYYGDRTHIWEYYRLLPGYLETATDLDPEFAYLYQFGGEIVPERDPVSQKFRNTGAAIRLLEKGMRSHSARWQIPFLLAYNLYTYRGDYLDAGHYMEEAARRPRAPAYLTSFAPKLLAQGGSVDTAIAFTQAALDREKDEWTKKDLERRLQALYLQQALERLNRAADARRATGQTVSKLDDLVGYAGILSIPEEPFGGRFLLNGDRVSSTDDDKLLRVFVRRGPPTEPYID